MTLGLVVQVVVSGLASGAIYGLVGMGFALVWRLTSVFQFAHGDLVGASVFAALFFARGTGVVTQSNVSAPRYVLAVAAAVVLAGLAGAGLYLAVLRPFLKRGSAIGWIGATVAVAFAVEGSLAALFPRQSYVFPGPFGSAKTIGLPGGGAIEPRTIYTLVAGAALALIAGLFLKRSRFGVAVSAIASSPHAAQFVGLPVDRLVAMAFGLAGVLAALAGVIGAPAAGSISTSTGLLLGLKGIAAAVLARFGSPARVFAAALAIGVIEAAVASLHIPGFPRLALGVAWRDIAPLLLAVAVISVRPRSQAREEIE